MRIQLWIHPRDRWYADTMILEFTPYWSESPIQAQMWIGPPLSDSDLLIPPGDPRADP